MNARKKLNVGFGIGALLTAGAFGAMAESWLVFIVVLVIVLGIGVYQGDIRLNKHQHS